MRQVKLNSSEWIILQKAQRKRFSPTYKCRYEEERQWSKNFKERKRVWTVQSKPSKNLTPMHQHVRMWQTLQQRWFCAQSSHAVRFLMESWEIKLYIYMQHPTLGNRSQMFSRRMKWGWNWQSKISECETYKASRTCVQCCSVWYQLAGSGVHREQLHLLVSQVLDGSIIHTWIPSHQFGISPFWLA